MKKNYITPAVKTAEMEITDILANSEELGIGSTRLQNDASVGSKGRSDMDDDFDDLW